MDCTNPEIEEELTKAVEDALYIAQLCDPTLDQLKCNIPVPTMCCGDNSAWADPGYENMNMPNVTAYYEALQKWKDAGCTCPQDPPVCEPLEGNFGFCNGEGFPAENEGICQKDFP